MRSSTLRSIGSIVGIVGSIVIAPATSLPGQSGPVQSPSFERGHLSEAAASANEIDGLDVDALELYFTQFQLTAATCFGPILTPSVSDANDNTPAASSATLLGATEPVITIADLLQLQARVENSAAALPPPAMCDSEGTPASAMEMDSNLKIMLEPGPFSGGTQQVTVKLGRATPAFVGPDFAVHGVGLALRADPSIIDATFVPATTEALDFEIALGPAELGGISDSFLLHFGSVDPPIATLGATEIVLGTITLQLPAGLDEPLLPADDIDGDGRPDPVQLEGRNFHTTLVDVRALCFAENEFSPPDLPCFVDHVPVMGDVVVIPTDYRRGDANSDGRLDIADGVFILQHLFLLGGAPSCADAGDFDASGALGIGDAMGVFSHQLLGGVAPAAPHPSCGVAPGGEILGCASYPALCD